MVHVQVVGEEGEDDIPDAAEESMEQGDLSLNVFLTYCG